MFLRPCFLVVDREFAGSISTRKLVLETAKFNVITAYDYAEGLATLERFPKLDAVVISAGRGNEAENFLRTVKERYPDLKRVMTGEAADGEGLAHRRVASFSPDKLLEALRDLFPQESATADSIERKLESEME